MVEVSALESLFALAVSPAGGAFFLGVIVGLGLAWWFLAKYIMPNRLKAAESLCAAKIEALQKRLDIVEPVAQKWGRFMERTAFEKLNEHDSKHNPKSLDETIG